LPDARSPRFGLSSPGTNNIIHISGLRSLSQEARRDDPRHTLADDTYIRAALRPPVTSTLHTLSVPALLVPARGVRRPFRLCAMLSNHTQDQILIIALCASRRMAPYTTVVRSLEYNRCPSPPQRCPYPRTTTALSRPIHPSTRHNTLYSSHSDPRIDHRTSSSHDTPLRDTSLFARHFASSHDHSSRSSIIFSPLPWLLYPSIAPPLWLLSSSIAPRLWLLPSIHGSS